MVLEHSQGLKGERETEGEEGKIRIRVAGLINNVIYTPSGGSLFAAPVSKWFLRHSHEFKDRGGGVEN